MLWQRRATLLLLCALVGLAGCKDATKPQRTLATSAFDASLEDWVVVGDAQSASFSPSGGNPGGHASAADSEAGDTWYWRAPDSFLAALAQAYGGTLRFDLKQSATDSQFDDRDVSIRGGTVTLVYDFPNNPGREWITYTVRLHESAGWVDAATRQAATGAQFREVLSAPNSLRIRGEFRMGSDTGGLDNVAIISR